jgi:hypothetical protein
MSDNQRPMDRDLVARLNQLEAERDRALAIIQDLAEQLDNAEKNSERGAIMSKAKRLADSNPDNPTIAGYYDQMRQQYNADRRDDQAENRAKLATELLESAAAEQPAEPIHESQLRAALEDVLTRLAPLVSAGAITKADVHAFGSHYAAGFIEEVETAQHQSKPYPHMIGYRIYSRVARQRGQAASLPNYRARVKFVGTKWGV